MMKKLIQHITNEVILFFFFFLTQDFLKDYIYILN